jgi:hypothetical protein
MITKYCNTFKHYKKKLQIMKVKEIKSMSLIIKYLNDKKIHQNIHLYVAKDYGLDTN